jgi:hypothetical protein
LNSSAIGSSSGVGSGQLRSVTRARSARRTTSDRPGPERATTTPWDISGASLAAAAPSTWTTTTPWPSTDGRRSEASASAAVRPLTRVATNTAMATPMTAWEAANGSDAIRRAAINVVTRPLRPASLRLMIMTAARRTARRVRRRRSWPDLHRMPVRHIAH